jgi:DNA polymerase
MIVVGPQGRRALKEGTFPPGEEGAYLAKLMEGGFGLPESRIYVTPAVKCCAEAEGAAGQKALLCCGHLTRRQAELVRPRAVVAMGTHAARSLLRSALSLGLLRCRPRPALTAGEWRAQVWITYGIAHVAASDELKHAAWEDLRRLKKALGPLE